MADETPRGITDRPTTPMAKKHAQYSFRDRVKSPVAVAKVFLHQQLENGPVPEEELKQKATEAGISASALGQAKKVMEIEDVNWEVDGVEVPAWQMPATEYAETVQVLKEGSEVTIDARQSHEDQFSLTDADRARYGIRNNEQHCWIRDPFYWNRHAPGDPVRDHERGVPGARVIIHNGDFVTNGEDLVLAVVPMEYVEARKRAQQMAAKELEDDLAGDLRRDSFTQRPNQDDMSIRELAEMNQIANRNAGLTGPLSPSSGLEYDDYVKYRGLKPADVRREAVKYALGTFYRNDLTDAQIQHAFETGQLPDVPGLKEAQRAAAAEQREAERQEQRRDNGGRFTSLPSGPIRPRNLARR